MHAGITCTSGRVRMQGYFRSSYFLRLPSFETTSSLLSHMYSKLLFVFADNIICVSVLIQLFLCPLPLFSQELAKKGIMSTKVTAVASHYAFF